MSGAEPRTSGDRTAERSLDDEFERFFATRMQGPADAREAVLAALAAGRPHLFARAACSAAVEVDVPPSRARRVGFVAEVLRAALRVAAEAYRQKPLPSRLERARRVLAADTLLTFAYELAADVPGEDGRAVRSALARRVAGQRGFLEEMCSGAAAPDPERTAAEFLSDALLALAAVTDPEVARARLRRLIPQAEPASTRDPEGDRNGT